MRAFASASGKRSEARAAAGGARDALTSRAPRTTLRSSAKKGGPMNLLEAKTWTGKLFLDGWRAGGGGERAVAEPATGGELGRVGMANAADVRKAAARAAEAQRAWAAEPYEKRAAVLRKAGDLWERHAEEIQGWIVRESGAIPPFGPRQTQFAIAACHGASGLAALPYGEILRTDAPHLSFARRVPVGVVGVISPFNAPLILSIRAVAPALA